MWRCCFSVDGAAEALSSSDAAAAAAQPEARALPDGAPGSTPSLLQVPDTSSRAASAHVLEDAGCKRISERLADSAAAERAGKAQTEPASITAAVVQHAAGPAHADAASEQQKCSDAAATATSSGLVSTGPGPSPSDLSSASHAAPGSQQLSPQYHKLPRSTSHNGTQPNGHAAFQPHSRSPSQAGAHGIGPHIPGHLSGFTSASISRMHSLLFGPGHGGSENSPHSCNGSVLSSDTWGNMSVLSGNLSVLSDQRHASMASDVLAKFLQDVNQYDSPGTVHLLQQDLRNLTLIGRGGCGVVYQVRSQQLVECSSRATVPAAATATAADVGREQ